MDYDKYVISYNLKAICSVTYSQNNLKHFQLKQLIPWLWISMIKLKDVQIYYK